MSFITKRERVFNEYKPPVDLPPRNEGKLKAYSSCTDTRAWSHFSSDKTEHLIEIIKRNQEICRGKYVPINVIVEMLMAAKNAEIARLKRKIGQLEQMLAAYDQLELSCEQKCEISTAHAMIKAANKSLEALPPLELDISGFTEGIDSEGFQTGKSGGDDATNRQKKVEWMPSTGRSEKDRSGLGMESQGFGPFGFDPQGYEGLGEIDRKESKSSRLNQPRFSEVCACDVSTSAHDNRVEELQETLISKDAKLNAMQNTIAVMENDVCEPYCIYAHVFTALEKIYGTLRQNEKYRLFLDLMSTGKDTRCLDIKGKILFKLKVLEKFSIALISPCSERFKYDESCECYAAQVETTFAVTQSEQQTNKPSNVMPSEVMRSQLIADIMGNDEIKEIITKDTTTQQPKSEDRTYDVLVADNYSIDTENLNRIKTLQADYEELMNAYEDLKYERDTLKARCLKYEELNKELEDCRSKLREYNMLYNEREYYRKRSEDLDSLKEQYFVLADETSSLETQLKAESEINLMKTGTIDELRCDNIALEQKLNDLKIACEKERNALLCKLKEAECKIMCQDQQIKTLSTQIDRIIEQDPDKPNDGVYKSATIIDEMEALRDQIKSLNDALYACEDEKQQLQDQFEEKLKIINNLKMDIEEWKSTCEKTLQRNEYLENYTESFRDEVRRLVEENRLLSQEVEEKTTAVANLINIINNKSQEVNRLINDIKVKKDENAELKKQLQDTKDAYGSNLKGLENEKYEVLESLQLARQESKELLEKVKEYDDVLHKKEDMLKSLARESESCNELRNMLANAIEDNKKLQQDLYSHENNNSILLQEIQRLREINNYAVDNINSLQSDKDQYKASFELIKKESEILEDKLKQFDDLREQLQSMRLSHERLLNEKDKLANELQSKARDLDEAVQSVELTKKESEHLLEKIQHSENLKEDLIKLSKDYQKLVNEKQELQKDLVDKSKELNDLLNTLSELKAENAALLEKTKSSNDLEQELGELKKAYHNLLNEKAMLQKDFDNKTQEIHNLHNTLEEKIDENKDLVDQIKTLEGHHMENMNKLQDVNLTTQTTLNSLRRESEELLNKLKNYETLLNKYDDLKKVNHQMKLENERLQGELEKQIRDLKVIEQEKDELQKQTCDVMSHSDNLEKALIEARQELMQYTTQNPFDDVVREIEEMKKEKLSNSIKIKELLDKLDESDNIISNLSEDLLARDDRIAVLENHINSLEDEIRQLHECLAEVVDTGEQLKDNSVKKIDQTLHKMEAHHSKATHNMKMELAKLHSANATLQEQISVHKIKSKESFKEQHKYVTQIIHLQNEREIIATEIKQLELNCVGDSNLSPTSCGVEEILKSLDKIRKCIDARNSKSVCLEQTLQKVQNSSQLLLSKADEAKKLVEKEKQKIINEKEEAIADRLNMERQLLDLKVRLEEQTLHDKKIIKDLEGEILNQKLIIDKLNESTQSYITKLEDEIRSLRDLYQNAMAKIDELQEKLKNLTEENDRNLNVLDKVNYDLIKKSKEVSYLQKDLEGLKNKPVRDFDVQVGNSNKKKNTKSQTDKLIASNLDDELGIDEIRDDENTQDINAIKVNKSSKSKTSPEHKPISQLLNEVQVLTANVEPPVELVKSYVDYKKKRLGPGKLEQFSILTDTADSISSNPNLVDIYRQSDTLTVSSNATKTDGEIASTSVLHDPQRNKHYTGRSPTNDISDSSSKYQNELKYPKPGPSSDKDLFLIYQDSESNHGDKSSFKGKSMNSRQQEILVETVSMKQNRPKMDDPSRPDQKIRSLEEDEVAKQDHTQNKVKQPLEVNVPRILTDDTSYETITDISSNHIQTKSKQTEDKKGPEPVRSNDSHSLSRVDANFLLFKDKGDERVIKSDWQNQQSNNFGLKYLLESVQHDVIHPEKLVNINKKLHKSLSDDVHSHLKEDSENVLFVASSGRKANSAQSKGKLSDYSQTKPVSEQGVMVNIDPTDYYENKIRNLSQQLESNEKDYKKKIDAIKAQYDNNIKGIINEHNLGVKSIQSLHEDALQDVIKMHENEVESLRSMSIEAMRKAEKLEKENRLLKTKVQDCSCGCVGLDEGSIKPEIKKRRSRHRDDTMMLTKTNIEAFNVKPRLRIHGPCTCSLDVNVSDTIRNIFEQVDVEQRKLAEHAYLKYIANKIMTVNVESLDVHELSFLHLKVCRTWKSKLSREEALQKRIDSLECELLNKKRCTQQHIAELDRKVAEERRRLQEAREAVCRHSLDRKDSQASCNLPNKLGCDLETPPNPPNTEILQTACSCNSFVLNERRSAGDLLPGMSSTTNPLKLKTHKPKPESRATLAKLDVEERRVKKLYDEPPTRLRRSHERPARAPKK